MGPPNPRTCSRCGAALSAATAEAICSACLLSGAIGTEAQPTPSTLHRPEEPADFPREFGGYRLLGLLGKGGMGRVYEAEQVATGRRVALKMLEQQLDSAEMRQRFLREGRLAASVNHPRSLYVFGSEEVEGVPVITMEIAGGGTLKDELKKRGPFSVPEAVDAILDVVDGLESASTAGVLHRDVKPSNCFVSPDGSVKVGDFGLSVSTLPRDDSYATAAGAIMGTPAYASPEQLRGDDLDLRADIYSVGATLYTLLSGHAPIEGKNAVQVVANAVHQKPKPLAEWRGDVPQGLQRVVDRCLAKEPELRFADYSALRLALLPFSSKEPEPASLQTRAAAGWLDYLVGFLPPYVTLMFWVGGEKLLVRPLIEGTLEAARYYLLLLGLGCLYFTLTEGIWGFGIGKWLKGLRVVRDNGMAPGAGRAFLRVLVPVGSMEAVRIPILMVLCGDAEWTGFDTMLLVVSAVVCGWIPVLLALRAGRDTGFATFWDRVSGTRVIIRPRASFRPQIKAVPISGTAGSTQLGPFQVTGKIAEGWLTATDPVLRREVWAMQRQAADLPEPRREIARLGRPRWLQEVEAEGVTWDVLEAPQGSPLPHLLGEAGTTLWTTLRLWLHDLAEEMWAAAGDRSLPAALSLDQVWVTTAGRAMLIDRPWPEVSSPSEKLAVEDLAGQQRFLHAVAAHVDATSLPFHARSVLQNLKAGKFEKLSFLTGTLQGLLNKPAEVSRGVRAGALFLVPFYVWIAVLVGYFHNKPWSDSLGEFIFLSGLVVAAVALVQLLAMPLRSTASQSLFRLAVVNSAGKPATAIHLLARWALVWLPLLLPLALVQWLWGQSPGMAYRMPALVLLLAWLGAAAYAVLHPRRGFHDWLAGTWVVRR